MGGPEEVDSLYTEALANANEAIEDRDNNPLGYLLAGRALMGLGRWVEASAAFDKAEELRPVLYAGDRSHPRGRLVRTV